VSKRIDVKNENIYYGDFLAVKDVNVTIEPKSVTALIRSLRLREVHLPAHPQPHARGQFRALG